jgi:Cof subfamily protein (haloacid dehalogenase superfamily)
VTGTVVRPDIRAAGAPRPTRRPRVVALDVDGTLIDDRQRLHPRTRAAVRNAGGAGVEIVLATGRMYRSALPWARELDVRAPLICYQGAVVRAMPTDASPVVDGVPQGELIIEDSVDPDCALRALEVARTNGWHIQAYRGDVLYLEHERREAHIYARIAHVGYTLVDDLTPVMEAGSTKVVCVVTDSAGAQRCEDALRAALGDGARVVRSVPEFVEVVSPRAGKARGLRAVCELLQVGLDEVVAVGDAPNDVDMLEAAGFGVAMRTSRAEVIEVADAVCAPPEEAGVADVLEALGLVAG